MKTIKILKIVFLGMGVAMLLIGVYLVSSTISFIDNAIEVEGVIIGLEPRYSDDGTTYSAVYQFRTVEGQPVEKVSSTSSNPPSYFEGERIRVLYIPSNPQDASIKAFFSLWGGSVIVGALGLVFFLIGGGMVLFPILRGKKEAHLREHGEAVQAEIQSVDYNERVEVNGKNPFIITAQWQDPKTSDLHVFTSANIWFDPSDYIKEDHVTAYVDKEDRSRYFIDLSFLPKVHGV